MTPLNESFDNEGKGIVLDDAYVFKGLSARSRFPNDAKLNN